MKAGPKGSVLVGRLNLSDLPKSGGARVAAFIAKYLSPPKGAGHDEPLELRDWQRELVNGVFNSPRPRSALWAIPRANGKSTLAAALALYALFADSEPNPQVIIVATSEKQAGIIFDTAVQMVADSPPLADRTQVFADRLVVPETGGTLTALPAEESALQGYDPSLAIVDEIGYVSDPVFESVMAASGKRARSLVLCIGTPSPYRDGPMWRMVERGRAGSDPSFHFREFKAPTNCDSDDEAAWQQANPAMTGTRPFLFTDAMRSVRHAMRDTEFRRLRLGLWVDGESSWIGWDEWAACADRNRTVQPGDAVCLAFDGSASGDSTALIGCTSDLHLFVLGLWQNPGDERWRVDRTAVDDCVDAAFSRYKVTELACDPWGWRSEIDAWDKRYPNKVVEWPTNVVKRMAPATDRLYQAVHQQQVTHDGNADLASHVSHCVAKATPLGDLIYKPRDRSTRKIDAAVASVVAFDRASWHKHNAKKNRWAVSRR